MKNILELANEQDKLGLDHEQIVLDMTADYWNVYLKHKQATKHTQMIKSEDIGIMVALMHLAKEENRHSEKHLINMCGCLNLASFCYKK